VDKKPLPPPLPTETKESVLIIKSDLFFDNSNQPPHILPENTLYKNLEYIFEEIEAGKCFALTCDLSDEHRMEILDSLDFIYLPSKGHAMFEFSQRQFLYTEPTLGSKIISFAEKRYSSKNIHLQRDAEDILEHEKSTQSSLKSLGSNTPISTVAPCITPASVAN
jgi:hypothetical protein